MPDVITVLAPDGSEPFTGSPAEAHAYLEAAGWSDGLPVLLPEPARVADMLRHTKRHPDEVLGVVGDGAVTVTVRTVAVNAVLAGCRDEDFPIVLALAEIMTDPAFRVRDAGSTTSWEVLPILSGPQLEQRGINCGPGVTRIGRRANSTIGRFTRLWIRNCASIRIPPDWTDMAAIGQSVPVLLAEDDLATHDLGWPSLRSEWGYAEHDTVIAGLGVVGVSAPIYTAGPDAGRHLDVIAGAVAGASESFGGLLHGGRWTSVLVLTPATAGVLAGAGLSKDDVRAHLAGSARTGARALNDAFQALGHPAADYAALVTAGELPPSYIANDDPDRLVPVIPRPTDLQIVVAGNPGRCQAKYYVPVGRPGGFATRAVGAEGVTS